VIGILAANRLGAIHSIVFGGFAPNALAQRIDSCRPVAVLTASCGIDGNKPPIAYKGLVEEAIRLAGKGISSIGILTTRLVSSTGTH
jgi:propionyl-CoA synthetase